VFAAVDAHRMACAAYAAATGDTCIEFTAVAVDCAERVLLAETAPTTLCGANILANYIVECEDAQWSTCARLMWRPENLIEFHKRLADFLHQAQTREFEGRMRRRGFVPGPPGAGLCTR